MPSKKSIRRWLWNAPPTAGFWVVGVAFVIAVVGGIQSPVVLRVGLIVLAAVLGLFGALLIMSNRDHKPESWSPYQVRSDWASPADPGGSGT